MVGGRGVGDREKAAVAPSEGAGWAGKKKRQLGVYL